MSDPEPQPLKMAQPAPAPRRDAAFSIGRLDRKRIHCVVAIVSGKGGVGKSLVTALLAAETRREGARVGVLDADITGPSIARLFGLSETPALNDDGKTIRPSETRSGISVMSMALVTATTKIPLIWRGPMVNSAIRGLFRDTAWPTLDYLFVDLPPGTSDAPMTVFQSLDPDGIVLVTAPTELSAEVVTKAATMAKTFQAPILGLVENMAYLTCPHGERIDLFGPSRGPEFASQMGVPFLGSLPIQPDVPGLCDAGKVEEIRMNDGAVLARRVRLLADRLTEARATRRRTESGGAPSLRKGGG